MVVNDYACDLDKRGALESIAGSSRLLQVFALSVFPGVA
jgi:hypothetical protein